MTRFNIRVELKGEPDWDTYEELHERMLAANYYRTITSNAGDEYQLPHAEYIAEADWTLDAIVDEVWSIANQVWTDPAVYVTIAGARKWRGLDRA